MIDDRYRTGTVIPFAVIMLLPPAEERRRRGGERLYSLVEIQHTIQFKTMVLNETVQTDGVSHSDYENKNMDTLQAQ